MKSELRILSKYLNIAFKRLFYYKANVALLVLYWMVSMAVLVVFWKVLFQFLPQQMGEWNFEKLAILNSLCYISWGVFTVFWGFSELPDKVVSGDLDKYLSRPMSLLTGVLGDGLHLEAIYEIAAGIVAVGILMMSYELNASVLQILMASATLLLGTFTLILVHASLALLAFWFGRVTHLQQMVSQFDEYQRYPISFFPKGIKSILIYGIPLFFPSTLAAQILLGLNYEKLDLIRLLVMLSVWVIIYIVLYKECLKRYESHGS